MIYFFISLVTYFCFLVLKSRKALFNLEKSKYDIQKYKKWVFTKKNFVTLELFAIFLVVIAIYHDAKVAGISAIVFYMILSLLELKNFDDKFKFNKKNIKIIIFEVIIYLLVFGIIITDYILTQRGIILYSHIPIYYLIIVIMGYLNYVIIYALSISKKKAKKGKTTKSKQNHKLK